VEEEVALRAVTSIFRETMAALDEIAADIRASIPAER
jgi:hypothetical protein